MLHWLKVRFRREHPSVIRPLSALSMACVYCFPQVLLTIHVIYAASRAQEEDNDKEKPLSPHFEPVKEWYRRVEAGKARGNVGAW